MQQQPDQYADLSPSQQKHARWAPGLRLIRTASHNAGDVRETMMRGLCLALLFCVAAVARSSAQRMIPERTVQGNVVTSRRDPAVRIKLPHNAVYVGAARWPLFSIADCEIHLFVVADEARHVQKLFWIQFESFLPDKPELKHVYKPTQTVSLDGLEFDARANFGGSHDPNKPGSDAERVRQLLQEHGYTEPENMMSLRFVRLLDPSGRKELMVIYAEDLAPTG